MNDAEVRAALESFLAAHHTMSLATVDERGEPHAASLMYLPVGLSLVWMSKATVRHSQHLAARPRVAATVAPDTADYSGIRGVPLVGTARSLEDPAEAAFVFEGMTARYPFLRRVAEGPGGLGAAVAQASFYRLDPARITWIDNTRCFGFQRTLELVSSP